MADRMGLAVLALLLILAGVGVGAGAATPAQNLGAEEIVLDGGSPGKINFPHRRHEEKLKDCALCHTMFPEKAGAIQELKAEGKLKKMHVMNTLCVKCHKQKQQAGEKAGPTTCTKCHIKG